MNDTAKLEFNADSVPKQKNGFELTKTACCYFLKQEETNNMIKLNDSSALIWQVCTGEWTLGEIIEVLKESYPDAADGMEGDVHLALGQLVEEGAIDLA